eukprot:1664552-Pyramimonas_sp.AAC.1
MSPRTHAYLLVSRDNYDNLTHDQHALYMCKWGHHFDRERNNQSKGHSLNELCLMRPCGQGPFRDLARIAGTKTNADYDNSFRDR